MRYTAFIIMNIICFSIITISLFSIPYVYSISSFIDTHVNGISILLICTLFGVGIGQHIVNISRDIYNSTLNHGEEKMRLISREDLLWRCTDGKLTLNIFLFVACVFWPFVVCIIPTIVCIILYMMFLDYVPAIVNYIRKLNKAINAQDE